MSRVQNRENMPSGAERIRQAARRKPEKLTALLHHLTPETLGAAYDALKREAAPGVDGMSWEEYEQGRERLRDLHGRVHRGAYRAKPGGEPDPSARRGRAAAGSDSGRSATDSDRGAGRMMTTHWPTES